MRRRTSLEGDRSSQNRRIVLRSSSCSSVNAMLVGTSSLLCSGDDEYIQGFDLTLATPQRIGLQRLQRRAEHRRCVGYPHEDIRDKVQVDWSCASRTMQKRCGSELVQH